MHKIKKRLSYEVIAENAKINSLMDSESNRLESIFVVSGIIGVLARWVNDDFPIPSADLAEALNAVIAKINKG